MIQSSNKKEGEGVAGLELALRAVASAMGCFFGCFRVKDSHVVSPPEPVVSQSNNALSSLFLCDDDSLGKGENCGNPVAEDIDFRELKTEAKFLKACGTIAKTPVEIRKASEKWKDVASQNGKENSLRYKISFANESTVKLDPKKLPDENPTPIKNCEEWTVEAGSLEASPSSCLTEGHNIGRCSISSVQCGDIQNAITLTDVCDSGARYATSSVSPMVLAPTVQGKCKSVRFDCEFDGSNFSSKGSSEGASQHAKQCESAGSSSESKASPYPTPVKLSDGMQTPGTVFPARIKSQYVISVENPSQSDSDHQRVSHCVDDEATLTPTMMTGTGLKTISVKENNEASLSCWLKLSTAKQDVNNEHLSSISGENNLYGRTPGDRPILGMVAAHWKYDESSRISPVMWDGNGIPNSTNKYKEDQKVSWHATPFEERLEKALSEGTFASQRNTISGTKLVELDEIEESDTAMSRLQSSTQSKPVVSFC